MKKDVSLIILYDTKKRFLLQHRTKDALIMPDFWAFFGGGIEEGETPKEAIRRETREELGYNLQNPKLLLRRHYQEDNKQGEIFVFVECFNNSSISLKEGQNFGWYTTKETIELKMAERDRKVIDSLSKYLDDSYKEELTKDETKRN